MNRQNPDISKAGSKEELIHQLARLRLRSDFAANAKGITEAILDNFSEDEMAALPEATIVHITDAYFIMRKKGVADADIFKRIDLQRSLLDMNSTVPAGIDLKNYIKWRLGIEFPQLASLEEMVVDMEILYALQWFSRSADKPQHFAAADKFAAQTMAAMKSKYLNKTRGKTETPPLAARQDVEDSAAEESTAEMVHGSSAGKWLLISLLIGLLIACAGALAYFAPELTTLWHSLKK